MKTEIAIMGDLCRENGFEDQFLELTNTHLVFFQRFVSSYEFDEDQSPMQTLIGTFKSQEDALKACDKGGGRYQILNVHENTWHEHTITNTEDLRRQNREIEADFQARYGRPMAVHERLVFYKGW